MTMQDLLGGIQLVENQCIVALDEGGTAWVIARSEGYRDKDVLAECSADDNGFNSGWDKGLTVGVYLVTLRPWAHQDYEGGWDAGIDVVKVEPLWTVGRLAPNQIAQEKAEERWVVRFYDSFDGWLTLPLEFISKRDASAYAEGKNAGLAEANKSMGEYYAAYPADTQMVFDAKYDPYRTGRNAVTEGDAGA